MATRPIATGRMATGIPTGRLAVIEHYQALATGRARDHGWSPGRLTQQAEEAGWILVRSELITGTNHFIAVFVQKDVFPVEQPKKKAKPAESEKKE